MVLYPRQPQEGWALGQWLQVSVSKGGKISSSFIMAMTIRLVTKTLPRWAESRPCDRQFRFSLKLLLLIYQEAVEISRHRMHDRTGSSSCVYLLENRKKGM